MLLIEKPTPISFEIDNKTITGNVEGSPEDWTFESEDDYFLQMTAGQNRLLKLDILEGNTPYNLNVLDNKITTEIRKLMK